MENNRREISRPDGRKHDEIRPVTIRRGFTKYAEGSVLIEIGDTRVICNATVEDGVPEFLEGSGSGWLTAEYAMLPRSTDTRGKRGASGRASEIQRLVGRTLRSVVDLSALGPRTIRLDCDVIQADGGTRTASITGSFVALNDAISWLRESGSIDSNPVIEHAAATSVGVVGGIPMLDLCYEEDSHAEVDLNVVMTRGGRIIEVQGTAEGKPFERRMLDGLLDLAFAGIQQLIQLQVTALEGGKES